MQVLILGAGLAGLSAAWHLQRQGHSVCIVERGEHVGGLASSVQVGPYTLDHGPHRFHSRDPELAQHFREVLDDEVVTCERRSRIHLRGEYFDYPLRLGNVLRRMPTHVLARAGLDYLWARAQRRLAPTPERDFESWVVARFGRTLYEEFFGAYTAKAWRMPCDQISSDWAAQRISQTDLWDVFVKTLRPPRDGADRSLVTHFEYPARGGIGALAESYASKIRALGGELRLGTTMEQIELEDGQVARVLCRHAGELEVFEPDHVVNTTPLPVALTRVTERGAPWLDDAARAACEGLRFIGIVFVTLEVQRPRVMDDHWVYFPSPDLTVHRASEFKNFAASSAPEDSTAICCEITCLPGDERWSLSPDEAADLARRDLVRAGLLAPGEGRPLHLSREAHAYPVYDLQYRERLEHLRTAARRIPNLHTTGRQGLYRYNNMDHSIAMGRKVARALGPAADVATALPTTWTAAEAPALEYLG